MSRETYTTYMRDKLTLAIEDSPPSARTHPLASVLITAQNRTIQRNRIGLLSWLNSSRQVSHIVAVAVPKPSRTPRPLALAFTHTRLFSIHTPRHAGQRRPLRHCSPLRTRSCRCTAPQPPSPDFDAGTSRARTGRAGRAVPHQRGLHAGRSTPPQAQVEVEVPFARAPPVGRAHDDVSAARNLVRAAAGVRLGACFSRTPHAPC